MRSILVCSALFFFSCLAADASGDNVVLLNVDKATIPSKLPGECDVGGTVNRVFHGSAFHAGQAISLKVPCSSGEPALSPAVAVITGGDNVYFVPAPILRNSHLGLARVDDSGKLIWSTTSKFFAPWGSPYGYRVVDGAALPAL
jgi:hypothetical protein